MNSFLHDPVLVLNKHWFPIDACTAKEALSDAFCDRAHILCPDTFVPQSIEEWLEIPAEDDRFIQSVNSRVKVPEVIISTYDRIPDRKVVFSRRNLWKRDRRMCQYCGITPPQDEITIDHVVPRNQGGKTTFTNCVLACVACNKKKDARTPEQANMPLRRAVYKNGKIHFEVYARPKVPSWNPIYAVRRNQKMPQIWSKFLQHMIDELYWNTELVDQ